MWDSARISQGGAKRRSIWRDRDSVEVFADDGRVTITDLVFAPADADKLEFYAEGGKASVVSGSFWKLRSAWNQQAPTAARQ